MTAEYLRDAAAAAAVLGFFASTWFGWALEDPPPSWRRGLVAGAIFSLIAFVAGAGTAWANWDSGTVFDSSTSPIFGLVVGLEFAIAGLGAWVLTHRSRQDAIPPWIAFVVGIHFLPLGALLQIPILYVVAALIVVGSSLSMNVAAIPRRVS